MKFTSVATAPIAAVPAVANTLLPPFVAAERLLDHLARGRAIDGSVLRTIMTEAFGGSDAEGAWDWKTAYDACEAATVFFLRKYGRGMQSRGGTPAALLGMLSKLAALLPSQTRRSQESEAFQQFSTPIPYGFVASVAAAITPADLVLEPSAGTGLLAVFAELTGAGLALNELSGGRAELLAGLFPRAPVTTRPPSRPPTPGLHCSRARQSCNSRTVSSCAAPGSWANSASSSRASPMGWSIA